jgi:glucoamylase
MLRPILISTISILGCTALFGQATNKLATGSPGLDAHWPSAAKNGFGTSNTLSSKVWFTLNNGVMTEVYYPRLDVPNVQTLQFIFADADGPHVETEAEDTTHRIEVLDPAALTFRQINTARSGAYTITKTYVTDPERSSILIDVNLRWNKTGPCRCAFYVYYDPSLNNSGMHDSAWIDGQWLIASDADRASALTVSDARLVDETNGYFGTSDGLTQLRSSERTIPYRRAVKGNVVQTARLNFQLPFGTMRQAERFTVVLGFGRNAAEAIRNGQSSVRKGFESARREYEAGWHNYLKTLPRVEPK